MLRVLIVDDEPLARENLRILLETQRDIEIVGECGNAVEAIGAVHKLRPDVLFLDIQMPRISGLEMVGMLDPEHRPYIVFLTAFDEYAVKAFEEHAFDYLLKPIEAVRLEKTLARLRQERSLQDVSLADVHEVKVKACSTAANTWELRLVGMIANAFGCETFDDAAALAGVPYSRPLDLYVDRETKRRADALPYDRLHLAFMH